MCLDRKCGVSQGRARTVSASATIRVPPRNFLLILFVCCCCLFFSFLHSAWRKKKKATEFSLSSQIHFRKNVVDIFGFYHFFAARGVFCRIWLKGPSVSVRPTGLGKVSIFKLSIFEACCVNWPVVAGHLQTPVSGSRSIIGEITSRLQCFALNSFRFSYCAFRPDQTLDPDSFLDLNCFSSKCRGW